VDVQRTDVVMEPTLLLTAAVDPMGCAFTARASVEERLADYRHALRAWIARGPIARIVLCDGSSWDMGAFADLEALARSHGRRLELLSFAGQGYDRALGKGYGEIGIIAHALEQSRLIAEATHVFKATGRYWVANAAPFVAAVARRPELAVMCDLREDLRVADSRWFAATPAFLRERLVPLRPICDDSRKVFLEHALARAAHAALAAGELWALPPAYIRIVGVSGTEGRGRGMELGKRARFPLKRRMFRY
jgi:hypothetical protein